MSKVRFTFLEIRSIRKKCLIMIEFDIIGYDSELFFPCLFENDVCNVIKLWTCVRIKLFGNNIWSLG